MKSESSNLQSLLIKALRLSLKAGDAIMEVYNRSDYQIEIKKDNSPLTLADKSSHSIILQGLTPFGIPVLSEEGSEIPWEIRKTWEMYWLIDPLDGTKEFIKQNDEFTVNIALMERNEPILGVIYLPVFKRLYFAFKGHGAYRFERVEQNDLNDDLNKILRKTIRLPDHRKAEGIRVLASRSHLSPETEEFIRELNKGDEKIELVSAGSSLKLCLIAEGKADVYPRMGPTMEWDIASGHIIITESGGSVFRLDNTPLNYNKPELLNPWFVAKSESYGS